MEAPEVPTEHLHEKIHESAHESKERWITFVALTTALLAVLAAFASNRAGKWDSEVMIDLINSSDQWNVYQAKSIKSSIAGVDSRVVGVDAKIDSLGTSMAAIAGKGSARNDQHGEQGKPTGENDDELRQRYKQEMAQIKAKAESLSEESKDGLARHELFASSVTMFQSAIAIAAISILTRRKSLFVLSLVFVLLGVGYFAWGSFPTKHSAENVGQHAEASG